MKIILTGQIDHLNFENEKIIHHTRIIRATHMYSAHFIIVLVATYQINLIQPN
jgi:hypothetical protein